MSSKTENSKVFPVFRHDFYDDSKEIEAIFTSFEEADKWSVEKSREEGEYSPYYYTVDKDGVPVYATSEEVNTES